MVSINNFITSTYGCDKKIYDCQEYRRPVSKELEGEAQRASRLDVISQLVKAVLELVLYPFTALFLLADVVMNMSCHHVRRGEYGEATKTLAGAPLVALSLPLISVINHLRIAGWDASAAVGLISPGSAAVQRHLAYSSFPFGLSPMRFIYEHSSLPNRHQS